MKPPALEIRLLLSAHGMGWEYVARKQGEVIAASDGDAHYRDASAAMVACVAEIRAGLSGKGRGDGE
jgi:hypothetical protein